MLTRVVVVGGGVVIQIREQYIREANNILLDTKYYHLLTHGPTRSHCLEYSDLITTAFQNNVITKKERNFLMPNNPVTPLYYHLPKIHKSLTNPPGRPIIAGIGSLTSPLSEYIDIFLQKHVINLNSYLRDSASLNLCLKEVTWTPDLWWASLDVTALYSNIGHDLGIKSKTSTLELDLKMPTLQKKFIIDGIQFILTHNVFSFEERLYIQTCGTAMGTKFATSYANLFMGDFGTQHIYNKIWMQNIVMYKRYIDHMFFRWRGSKEDFDLFLSHLNSNSWGLSFSGTISTDKLTFLDLEISANNNTISTKTYFKLVDCNSLLNFQSSHYRKWLLNIPYSQMRRLQTNCSNNADFKQQSKVMKSRFLEKGYPVAEINDAIDRTSTFTQDQCLTTKKNPPNRNNIKSFSHNFITNFNKSNNVIRSIPGKHWSILCNDPHLKDSFQDT